ncbi:MAG: type II secretion system protein N [Bermanella sp.]
MANEVKKSRKLWYVSVLAYFVFLVALFPINIAYQLINPKNLPVQVVAVSGTLWDGQVVVKHAMSGQLALDWQLSPWSLLLGQVDTQFKVKGAQLEGEGGLSVGLISGDIRLNHVSAYINSALINQPLRSQRVTMAGDVELNDSTLVFNWHDKKTSRAKGRLIWAGGEVSYPKGRKRKQANLPMLVVDLSADKGELMAQVNTEDGLAVARANLKTDGWGSVAVQKRMVDLLGEPWSNKASPDSTIFELSEKLF